MRQLHTIALKQIGIFVILILFGSVLLKAQQVSFRASAPQVVQQGQQFEVTYTVNKSCRNFRYPTYRGFSFLGGPMTSSSSSVQIINGKVSRNETNSYTIYLQANKVGKFTLPPAQVTVNGKIYKSNAINIEVVAGNRSNSQTANGNGASSARQVSAPSKDLFVRVLTTKRRVYQGEQFIATIKIYTRLNISGFDDMKFPDFKGFWQDEIKTPSQIQLTRENINGKIYNVGILRKLILTPQHAGKLVIDPIDIVCIVQQRTRQRDFFGFPVYKKAKVDIKSPRVTIQVMPLPTTEKTDFTGAVGRFNLQTTINKTTIQENNPITLKIKLKGTGNLALIDQPVVNIPPDFESYDPKESDHISKTDNGTSGYKSWEFLIIPRHAGEFTIPPVSFTYFNPQTKRYKTLSSESFHITVKKGNNTDNSLVTSAFSKENVKYIGKDIHYLKSHLSHLRKINHHYFASWSFYLTYPIGLLLFLLIVLWRKKQIKEAADKAKTRNRKALSIAKKRLKKATLSMKEKNASAFFEEVSKAMWLLLADKLNIDVSDLTKDMAFERLREKHIDEDILNRYFDFIEQIDFQRFASQQINEDALQGIYDQAKTLIMELSNKF